MKNLFQNLIWPAVAGNVAWSFFTVAINESWNTPGVIERISVLLLLAIYLATDYTSIAVERLKPFYWIADAFHAISMIVFALATQFNESWLNESLIALFIIAACGHLSGLWEPNDCIIKKKWLNRLLLVGMNFIGIILTIVFSIIVFDNTQWNLPIAFFTVIILWFIWGRSIYQLKYHIR